jgi:hypothetical protein
MKRSPARVPAIRAADEVNRRKKARREKAKFPTTRSAKSANGSNIRLLLE